MKGQTMAEKSELLTSSEFSSKTGISKSKVSKLIRDGKIKAEKKSGKWMINPDQLNAKAVKKALKPATPLPKKKAATSKSKKAPSKAKKSPAAEVEKPAAAKKSFSIAEFVHMTYLTEKGVSEWLKSGQLAGHQNDRGDWRIDAANLEKSNVKRLVRET
jgi:predicted site-specific integrase-resolvase